MEDFPKRVEIQAPKTFLHSRKEFSIATGEGYFFMNQVLQKCILVLFWDPIDFLHDGVHCSSLGIGN